MYLSRELIRKVHTVRRYTTTIFNDKRTLSLAYSQVVLGSDLRAFQVICHLDRTFVGYSYMQVHKDRLLLDLNDLSDHPGIELWKGTDNIEDHERLQELNEKQTLAFYIEPNFRNRSLTSNYTGLGTLLLRTSFAIGAYHFPRTERFILTTPVDKLPFYEQGLCFKKRFAYLSDKDLTLTFSIPRLLSSLDRSIILKQKDI